MLSELRYLSAIPELKIFEMAKNPCMARAAAAGCADVRAFAKFLMPRLRTIDRVPVSEKERAASRRLFTDGAGNILEQQLDLLERDEPLLSYLAHSLGGAPATAAPSGAPFRAGGGQHQMPPGGYMGYHQGTRHRPVHYAGAHPFLLLPTHPALLSPHSIGGGLQNCSPNPDSSP